MFTRSIAATLSLVQSPPAIDAGGEVTLAQMGQVKPALEALGPYPIIQFFAALIIMVVMGIGGLAWLKSEKKAKADAAIAPLDVPRTPDGAIQLFFDGPLKAIFDCLHLIQTALALNKLETKDTLAAMLSSSRGVVMSTFAESQASAAMKMSEQHSAQMQQITELRRDVQSLTEAMIRIEASMMRRRQ
jgi:hypothetical protein